MSEPVLIEDYRVRVPVSFGERTICGLTVDRFGNAIERFRVMTEFSEPALRHAYFVNSADGLFCLKRLPTRGVHLQVLGLDQDDGESERLLIAEGSEVHTAIYLLDNRWEW